MTVLRAALCAALLTLFGLSAYAQGNLLPLPPESPIVGMNTPALSPDGKTLCFTYQGDLWTVPSSGGTAARLTVHEALDIGPRWSPDSNWIAFTSSREGNFDIYLIPAAGGEARQLTYHSASDWVMDWSPDGTKLLFYSQRGSTTFQMYTLEVKTGVVKTLTKDNLNLRYGVFSPDGSTIAYNRSAGSGTGVWWRPRYRGSANMEIYTRSLTSGKITRVTDYEGADIWPMYSPDGKTIYYVSDRLSPGVPNLVASPANGGRPTQITRFRSDEVRWPSMSRDGSLIAFLYRGELYTVPPRGGEPRKVVIYARSDDKTNNILRLTLTNQASEVEISPDGRTLALVVRGEIWTIPAGQGGDARRLTSDPANDYDIFWSPDSKRLSFVSDRRGNFDIYMLDVATREVKPISEDPNDESAPKWSPDGKWIAFLRTGAQGGLFVAPVDGSAAPRRLAEGSGNNLFGIGFESFSWSPDSKWIAFSRSDVIGTNDIWVVPAAGGKETNITYLPGDSIQPEWTSDGKYLLFLSTRDGALELYSLSLEKQKAEPDAPAQAAPAGGERRAVEVKIDFDEIEERAKRLTTQGASSFQITADGRNAIFVSAAGGAPDFWSVPVNGGAAQRLTTTGEGTATPRLTNDQNRFYALGQGGTVKAIQRSGPGWQAVPIAFSARLDVNRRLELAQAFNEFWRRMNVGFYDPKMHGVDWKAVRAKYEPQLAGVGTREEFALFFLSAMVGELNASHAEVSPAPGPAGPSTAQLGLTFDESYAGPGLKVSDYMPRGPNDDLGPKIKPGEYILTIDGDDVSWNESLYLTLRDKAGKTVELLVNGEPKKEGARTVKLRAITFAQWADLNYEREVREARALVEKLSNGRLGYVRIQGMNNEALRRFERELWGKNREKEGLVLDIRGNGGGSPSVVDALLTQLRQAPYAYTVPRDASQRAPQPNRRWNKPTITLIDENSASAAEAFPHGFRYYGLGRLVGNTTPGYLIAVFPGTTLQDGTSIRVPTIGWYTTDGKLIENVGVKPDIEVVMTPEDYAAGKDRALETAVENLLKQLPKK
jgi:tricorn protease